MARAVRLVTVVVAGLAAWWFLAHYAIRHGFFDLRVYYGAINYWAGGHGSVYDYLLPGTRYGFTYPPFAALTMLPMAALSWHATAAIGTAATVAVTLGLLIAVLAPVARREGWPVWFTVALAAAAAAVLEPLRETVAFGQINMVLLGLVAYDILGPIRRGSRWGGIAIGLATAVKLTPGIFIAYLLIVKRTRAAMVAAASTAAATVVAMLVAPEASSEFWTDAVWDTGRIGTPEFISNQSLLGLVARTSPAHPNGLAWAAAAAAVVAAWIVRVRAAARRADDAAGLALTGVLGCLISPITWIHHLVWLLPALLLLVDRGLARRRWPLLGLATGVWVLLSSRLVWAYSFHFLGWGLLGANAYVYASLALLVLLPLAGEAVPAEAAERAGTVGARG